MKTLHISAAPVVIDEERSGLSSGRSGALTLRTRLASARPQQRLTFARLARLAAAAARPLATPGQEPLVTTAWRNTRFRHLRQTKVAWTKFSRRVCWPDVCANTPAEMKAQICRTV